MVNSLESTGRAVEVEPKCNGVREPIGIVLPAFWFAPNVLGNFGREDNAFFNGYSRKCAMEEF